MLLPTRGLQLTHDPLHPPPLAQAIAYNLRDAQAAYTKPPLMTQEEWDTEMAARGRDETIVPVAIDGFDGLLARMEGQDKQITSFAKDTEVSSALWAGVWVVAPKAPLSSTPPHSPLPPPAVPPRQRAAHA